MHNLNSVVLEGVLLADPVFRYTPQGMPACTFDIVSKRGTVRGGEVQETVSCFRVEARGKLAETCGSAGKEGRGVRVVGWLRQDRWNGTDGKERERIVLAAEHVEWGPEVTGTSTDGKKRGKNKGAK
jgi:single-strand DNA-binding protein